MIFFFFKIVREEVILFAGLAILEYLVASLQPAASSGKLLGADPMRWCGWAPIRRGDAALPLFSCFCFVFPFKKIKEKLLL